MEDVDGFLVRRRRFSWEEATDERVLDQRAVQNAVSAFDLIVAVLNAETARLRRLIPRVNLASLWQFVCTHVPNVKLDSLLNVFKWIAGVQNRVLRGDEVELPAVMTKMDSSDDFMNSFSDDDETCSMRAASTVCSQANEKRINELESQLAELRQTMMLLLQKQGAKPASQPPEKVVSCIPSISKTAPPPPPPPPPSFLQRPPPPPQKTSPRSAHETDENKPPAQTALRFNPLDLSSVKLKKVARTPGGTPIRENGASDRGDDLAGIFAKALKHKFRNTGEDEDSADKETAEDEWEDDAPK